MEDIIDAVRQLPDRTFMASGVAILRALLKALIRPPKLAGYRVRAARRVVLSNPTDGAHLPRHLGGVGLRSARQHRSPCRAASETR